MTDQTLQFENNHNAVDQEYAFAYRLLGFQQLICVGTNNLQEEMEAQYFARLREDHFGDPDLADCLFHRSSTCAEEDLINASANDQRTYNPPKIQRNIQVQMIQARQNYQSGERLDETPTQSSLEIYEERQVPKKYKLTLGKKGKKTKRDPYPTKNFLPSFRASFLIYLKKHYQNPEEFEQFEVVKRIRGKRCINMQDYNDLFLVREFRPVLKQYFKNQVIMRDLFQSRIDYKTKLEYFKRIHVFEDAFNNGSFKKINY